jgi:DNA-binding response OmpR family regulator
MQARILVVDTDRDLRGLLEEWLATCGCVIEQGEDANAGDAVVRVDLVIVDIPHPKRGCDPLQKLAAAYPGTPIIALSSTFFPGIESTGGVARTLGVACVLAKPVGRESLITAVRSLLPR